MTKEINLNTVQYPLIGFAYGEITKKKITTSCGEFTVMIVDSKVIDYVGTEEYYKRRNLLIHLSSEGEIVFNTGSYISNKEELDEFYTKVLQINNTGIITIPSLHSHLPGANSLYGSIIRRKVGRFKCVGYQHNSSKYKDHVSLILITEGNREFKVKMKGNHAYQKELTMTIKTNPSLVIDREVEVEYSVMRDKPTYPVGLKII